jgi:hypothetical protein
VYFLFFIYFLARTFGHGRKAQSAYPKHICSNYTFDPNNEGKFLNIIKKIKSG